MVLNGIVLTHAAEMTLAEKGISSAKVILTGFVVVFSVLLILIGVIKLYSFIIGKAQGAGGNKRKKKASPPQKIVRTEVSVSEPAQTLPAEDDIPEEVVAVIAAAVAAMYGSSAKARIKSIKKAGGRSAWANAGVLDNTRPF